MELICKNLGLNVIVKVTEDMKHPGTVSLLGKHYVLLSGLRAIIVTK